MRISVVTACFNNRSTIEDTLKSILGQTYPDVELIVVDGGSTDGTLTVIERYAKRIAKVISESDHGIYDALNKGIRAANGQVVGFLHADDMFADPSVVGKIAGCFMRDGIDGVYGDLVYVDSKDIGKVARYWSSGPFDARKLQKGWLPPHPTFYVKREVYEKYGLFDTSYRIAADYDVMLRFLLDKGIKVEYLPEVLVRMRLGGASNRNLINLIRKSREDFSIIKKHQIPFPALTLVRKNISKFPQFILRPSKLGVD